ncbi:MAG: DUF2878 domain-containing protein [Pseudomonadota bacterium]
MNTRPYSKVLNFAWYQLIWFTAVLGGSAFEWLLALLVFMHLALIASWRRELALMTSVALLGCSVDALLTKAGYFQFAESSWLPIPLWHMAIWVGFAGTLRHSLTFMVERPRLMTLAAMIFAPITYLAAQRLGAVTFPIGDLPTAIVIGLSWLTITPLILWLTAVANGALVSTRQAEAPGVSIQEQ